MSNSGVIFQKFQDLVMLEIKQKNYLLLSSKNRMRLKLILNEISINTENNEEFAQEFANLVIGLNYLPLEVLWNLQKLDIMYLNNYVYFNPEESTKLPSLLVELTCLYNNEKSKSNDNNILIKKMYTDFLIELLYACEGPQITSGVCDSEIEWSQTSEIVWQSVTRQLMHNLLNNSNKLKTNYLADIRETQKLTEKIMSKICLDHLQLICKAKPYTKVQSAIFHQSSWTKDQIDISIVNILSEILTHIEDPLEVLLDIMKQEEISWKWSLSAISICINILPNSTSMLKKIIQDLLHKAFAYFDKDALLMTFLLARQSSYENLTIDDYSQWYSKMFGIDSVGPTSKDKTAFEFLINFLTNIIPSESPQMLKVHLEKALCIPPGCLIISQEFKNILRARISDLDGSNNEIMIIE